MSLGLAQAAQAEGPPCLAQVEVAPVHAVVGQQVAYTVRVLRRPDVGTVSWLQGLSFPSFRTEWLPGLAGHTRLHRQGTPYLVYDERRALFPMRAGRLEIPKASLSCVLYAPSGGTHKSVEVEIPASAVDVEDTPAAGRPRSWSGLVGPVDVTLAAEPPAIVLGDSVRVTVTLTGDGNLWAAPAPFGQTAFEGSDGLASEVFARAPELSFDPGQQLHVRRTFAFELVPRRPGRLVIATYELPFFDPTRRRFAVSKTPPLEIVVASQAVEGAIHSPDGRQSAAASAAAPALQEPAGGGASLVVLGALAFLLVLGATFFRRWLRGATLARSRLRAALHEADRARRVGDTDGERRVLVHALRAGLERAVLAPIEGSGTPPAAGVLSAAELAERAEGDPTLALAAEILLAEESARFSRDRAHPEALTLRIAADALARRS